jgi:uncharacterized protein
MTQGPEDSKLEVLDAEECYRLLGTQEIGRLGVNADHYPLIFPVNYGIDRVGAIVIRTGPGTKLSAGDHANVTFEVDQIDPATRSGWSVLVRGLAEEVADRHHVELVERTKATDVTPWAGGDRSHWLRLIPHKVTGRRVRPDAEGDWLFGPAPA